MVLQKPNFLRSHPSVTIKPPLPRHGLKVAGVSSMGASGEKNANCFTVSKWQIPLPLVAPSPFEGVRLAAGGAGANSETLFARSPSGVQGGPPDTPLVTFVVKRKSPGCRAWLCHALAERLHQGWSAEEGPSPPRISGHAGAPRPCKKSPRGNAVPPLPIPRNEQKVASQRATPEGKNQKKGAPPCFSAGPVLYSI